MHLSDHDLKQLDDAGLGRLSQPGLLGLAVKLLADLKEARDRLNRTPKNSSQPPSTQKPWEKAGPREPEDDPEETRPDPPERPAEPPAAPKGSEERPPAGAGTTGTARLESRDGSRARRG